MTIPELSVYASESLDYGKSVYIPLEQSEQSDKLCVELEGKIKEVKSKLNDLHNTKYEDFNFSKVEKVSSNLVCAINFMEKSLKFYKDFVKAETTKKENLEALRKKNKELADKRIAELTKQKQIREMAKEERLEMEKEAREKRRGNPAFRKGFANPYMGKENIKTESK